MILIRLLGVDPIHAIHTPRQWSGGRLMGGRAMDREDGDWTPAVQEGGEEMLTQKEVNGHILVIVGLSPTTEKPQVTPGITPARGF